MLRLTMESVTGDGKFFHCSEILTSFEYTLPNQKLVIVVANRHNPSVANEFQAVVEAPTKSLKSSVPTSSSNKPTSSSKLSANSAIIDLSENASVTLTIIKDAIRSSGRFLSESPAVIIASKGAHVQSVIFQKELPLPLTNADICREAKTAFKGGTDFDLNLSKYTLHRFTPYTADFKETARSHAKPLVVLEILPGNYEKRDSGRVVVVLVCNETEDASTISQGGSGITKDQIKAKATSFFIKTVQNKFSRAEIPPAFATIKFMKGATVAEKHELVETLIRQVAMTIQTSEVNSFDGYGQELERRVGNAIARRELDLKSFAVAGYADPVASSEISSEFVRFFRQAWWTYARTTVCFWR